MSKAIPTAAAERIMVALDVKDASAAVKLAGQFEGIPCWMKIGMELFYAAGPSVVKDIKDMGFKLFLDLKLHDIPNTVRGAARSVSRLGVDMFNVHAAGGSAMMRAAADGAAEGVEEAGGNFTLPLIIAVTQLTSTNERMLQDELGIPGTVEESVVRYALLAQSAGLNGVVASAREAAAVKAACGSSFLAITPGIRPSGADVQDQARVVTPREALAGGSDYLVIGRPVTGAADPRQALESIIAGLEQP